MRRVFNPLHLLLFAFICLSLIVGCEKDDDDNPAGPTQTFSLWVVQDTDSTEVSAEGLPTIDVDGQTAVQLSEFVGTDLIPDFEDRDGNFWNSRKLYSYEVAGVDGFSAHANRGYANNTWEHMTQGYIALSTERAGFPAELGLAGAYNVSDVARILVHRKFDLETPDTTSFTEFRYVTSVEVTNPDGNPEQALPLSEFLDDAIITDPAQFTYNMQTIDEFGPSTDMTWEEFQTGYWLLETGKTMFTDPDLNTGSYKLKVLHKITAAPVSVP